MKNKKIENKAEQPKDNSKKKKILKYVLNVAVWGTILGFLGYSGCKMIDQKTGYKFLSHHSAVIVSDSMSFVNEVNYSYLDKDVAHIRKNDVIHTSNYKNYDEIQKLDVIIYLTSDGTLVCHRVVDKYVENNINWVVTRGDANSGDDDPVNYDLVRGKVTSVTGGGGAVLFFQSPYFVLAICCSGFFILLGYLIFNLKTEKKAAGADGESIIVEEKPIEEPKEEPVVEEKPAEKPGPVEETPIGEEKTPEELSVEEPVAEEQPEEQPKVEDASKPEKAADGRFIPKGGKQKKLNWPPKNTRWTKENNPTTNKKRAGGESNEK